MSFAIRTPYRLGLSLTIISSLLLHRAAIPFKGTCAHSPISLNTQALAGAMVSVRGQTPFPDVVELNRFIVEQYGQAMAMLPDNPAAALFEETLRKFADANDPQDLFLLSAQLYDLAARVIPHHEKDLLADVNSTKKATLVNKIVSSNTHAIVSRELGSYIYRCHQTFRELHETVFIARTQEWKRRSVGLWIAVEGIFKDFRETAVSYLTVLNVPWKQFHYGYWAQDILQDIGTWAHGQYLIGLLKRELFITIGARHEPTFAAKKTTPNVKVYLLAGTIHSKREEPEAVRQRFLSQVPALYHPWLDIRVFQGVRNEQGRPHLFVDDVFFQNKQYGMGDAFEQRFGKPDVWVRMEPFVSYPDWLEDEFKETHMWTFGPHFDKLAPLLGVMKEMHDWLQTDKAFSRSCLANRMVRHLWAAIDRSRTHEDLQQELLAIDQHILPRLRVINHPMLSVLPTIDDWLAYAMVTYQPVPDFRKRINKLAGLGFHDACAMLFATMGAHMRDELDDEDLKLYPNMLSGFLPELQRLLLNSAISDFAQGRQAEEHRRLYCMALWNGLLIYHSDEETERYSSFINRIARRLEKKQLDLLWSIEISAKRYPHLIPARRPEFMDDYKRERLIDVVANLVRENQFSMRKPVTMRAYFTSEGGHSPSSKTKYNPNDDAYNFLKSIRGQERCVQPTARRQQTSA